MVHYKLRNVQQFGGGYTDLFIVGATRAWSASTKSWGSDFTAAALTQDIVLDALAKGDVVVCNAIMDNPIACTGGAVSSCTASVGRNGAETELIAASSTFTADNTYADDGGPSVVATAAVDLECKITTVTANVNALTAGEIWIWLVISRKAERSTFRQA